MLTEATLRAMYIHAGLDPEVHLAKWRFAKQYEKDYYNVHHVCCPKCGCDRYSSTYMGFIINHEHPEAFKDSNAVECAECGWSGITHNLVRRKDEAVLQTEKGDQG